MITQFDIENIDAIIRKTEPKFDWFTAQLLQLLARMPEMIAMKFNAGYPEEFAQVLEWRDSNPEFLYYTEAQMKEAMNDLWEKADPSHRNRLRRSGFFENQYQEYRRQVDEIPRKASADDIRPPPHLFGIARIIDGKIQMITKKTELPDEFITDMAKSFLREKPHFFERTEEEFGALLSAFLGAPAEALDDLYLRVFRAAKKIQEERK